MAAKKKSTRTYEPKIRDIEELKECSIKSMTGNEAKVLVTYLREQNIIKDTKIEEYQHNIESTRKQNEDIIKKAEAMERYYRNRFDYITEATKNLTKSINLATKGDLA